MTTFTLDDVLQAYRDHGHLHYGEAVTELQHALQSAVFAREAGEQPVVVAAALLHDFGHLCHTLGEDAADRGIDAQHEQRGYETLRMVFSDAIADACRLHVAAKRYLCRTEPGYLDGLSEASRTSLQLQGGPMSPDEAEAFELEPHFALAVRVRRYDDMAKVPDLAVPSLDHYIPMLRDFLRPTP